MEDERITQVIKEVGNKEALKEHIKTVGQAIIDDAESIVNLNLRKIRGIDIEAEISPAGKVTTVVYHIHRTADPRAKG